MNTKRETLNYDLLTAVKQAFVAMPGGNPGPVAGGGMLTQAQAAPMGDPAAMGGAPMDPAMGGAPMDPAMGGAPMDPAMGGAPMDPAMAGGAPMDPAMAGGAPMDPAMAGGDPAAMGGMPPELAGLMEGGGSEGQVSMSSAEFTDLLVTLITTLGGGKAPKPKASGGEEGAPAAASGEGSGVEAKLDQVITLLGGGAAPQPGMM